MIGTGTTTAIQRGGQWISAKDTLNVLIVFVQFPDDRYDTTYSLWPKNQSPTFRNTYIDSLPSQLSSSGNLTHYFREMSFGALKLTGKTRFAITPHSRQWYLDNGWCRWLINKEVLEGLDGSLDFGEFDRWRRYGEYDVRREADGWVDMVCIIYRNVAREYPRAPVDSFAIIYDRLKFAGGEASLGYTWDCGGPSSFFVDSGQRQIGHGHPVFGHPGSGTTSEIGGTGDGWFGLVPYRVQIHELAHHWMTNGAAYGHNGGGFWAMLNNFLFRHNGAFVGSTNSFERELVAWHYPDSIGTNSGSWYNLSLTDFVTTNKSYKIKVPGGNPNEFFRLENHQRVSQFDTPEMLDASAKGLYITHQFGDSSPDEQIRLLPSDGRWDWQVQEAVFVPWFGNYLPVFKQGGINRVNGYHDSWLVPYSWTPPPILPPSPMEIIFWRDRNTNQLMERALVRGDGNDAYRLSKSTVFSPWSNPNSQNDARQKTWVAIEIVNETNGVVTFNLHIDSVNCLQTSPSKPQDLRISLVHIGYGNAWPKLTWAQVEEPDVYYGGVILIYRRVKQGSPNWGPWTYLAQVNGIDTEFIDVTISTAGTGSDSLQYKIQSRDYPTNKLSVFSDVVSMNYSSAQWKLGTNESLPSKFRLGQNYPNPFNPATTLDFDLPSDEFVSLKIFDVLGREVQTLVSEIKKAGSYNVAFDASKLASGVYVYKLQAGSFVATKKMLLAR
jgi:hypothetical protein